MELEHYGIDGQKWGIRRFQYEDGTLTPEGKERYSKHYNTSHMSRKEIKSLRKEYSQAAAEMSTQDLKEMVGRLNLQKQYRELTGLNSLTRGEELSKKIKNKFEDIAINKVINVISSLFTSGAGALTSAYFKSRGKDLKAEAAARDAAILDTLSNMSDQDLQKVITRMNNELKYKDLTGYGKNSNK